MARKKDKEQPPPPVVRVAPLGELTAYTISEHELDKLGKGSAVSDLLTIGYCLLSVAATVLVTLLSTTLPQLTLILFFCSLLIFTIAGGICLVIGWRTRISVATLVSEIKNRNCLRVMEHTDGGQLPEENRLETISDNDDPNDISIRSPDEPAKFDERFRLHYMDDRLIMQDVFVYVRFRKCTRCERVWKSVELPASILAMLLRHLNDQDQQLLDSLARQEGTGMKEIVFLRHCRRSRVERVKRQARITSQSNTKR
jgi:hypothetical protein